MNNSSAQLDYSITSSNTVDTITISDTANPSYYNVVDGSAGTITISGGGTSGTSYTIGSAGSGGFAGITAQGISTFNWNLNEEFVNCLPEFERVKKMCDEYPGLKIAYEKFVTTYKLVRDDYDTPKDKRPKP